MANFIGDTSSNLFKFFFQVDSQLSQNNDSKLLIRKTEVGDYVYETKESSFFESVSNYFNYGQPDQESVQLLKELIGKKRLKRIFQRKELGLNLKMLKTNQVVLTKAIVHKIFIGLAEVRFEDLEEAALKNNKQINTLTIEELDELYKGLFPIHSIYDIFTRHCIPVGYMDKPKTSGKGFIGLQERVWTIQTARHRFMNEHVGASIKQQIYELEMLTSRLGDREPDVGTVLRLHDTYFKVERIFSAGGAYISVLRELSDDPRILLLCRGTAARYNATGGYLSGLNDCLEDIGLLGIKKIWPDLVDYLNAGDISKVEILGKSLGGAHAIYLTDLIAGLTAISVQSLSTYCSVGAPPKVQEIYNEIFLNHPSEEPDVVIVRNTGDDVKDQIDRIPCVGGMHLRSSKTKVYYIAPQEESVDPNFIPEIESTLTKVIKLLKSFGHGHLRQTTLKDFKVFESQKIGDEVALGTTLESIRHLAVILFNVLTFGLLNRESFENYYRNLEKFQGAIV